MLGALAAEVHRHEQLQVGTQVVLGGYARCFLKFLVCFEEMFIAGLQCLGLSEVL